ncbi:hypothetical protein ACQGAO_31260 [Rhodococcus sp. 1.20]
MRSLARELGYSSESAFSAAFKRHVGEAPLSYRSRIRAIPKEGSGRDEARLMRWCRSVTSCVCIRQVPRRTSRS